MPRNSVRGLSAPARRELCVQLLARNALIGHIADTEKITAVHLNKLAEPDGAPNRAFARRCHDKFFKLADQYSHYAMDDADITHYSAFAEAVLRVRLESRWNLAESLGEEDPEHPDVTLLAGHDTRSYSSYSFEAVVNAMVRRREG